MISKHTNPYNDSVLFIQRRTEVADFVARQPRVLPVAPPAPAPKSLLYRLAIKAIIVVFVLLMLCVMALWFFAFGEDRPERVRPDITPAERAKAFRIPHH